MTEKEKEGKRMSGEKLLEVEVKDFRLPDRRIGRPEHRRVVLRRKQ